MEPQFDVVVIGAGVVGLAIGRELALAGREVLVLEKNAAIGEETSSRSSEVIHAGIYYPRASLKARLCVRGRDALYRYLVWRGESDFTTGFTLGLFPPTVMKKFGPTFITTNPSLQSINMPAFAKPVQLPNTRQMPPLLLRHYRCRNSCAMPWPVD